MAWSSFYSIPLLHFNGFYAIKGNDISYERENSGACAPFREKRPAAESRFSAHRLVRPGAVCESRTGIPPLAGFEVSVPDWCGNAGGTAEGLPFVPIEGWKVFFIATPTSTTYDVPFQETRYLGFSRIS